jgi:hypothetical protein
VPLKDKKKKVSAATANRRNQSQQQQQQRRQGQGIDQQQNYSDNYYGGGVRVTIMQGRELMRRRGETQSWYNYGAGVRAVITTDDEN